MKRILTVAALLLIVALALTACGGKDTDKESVYDILDDAIEKTVNSQKSESTSVWEEALNGGSIEALLNYEEDIIPIKTISGKYYYGKDSTASILSFALFSGEKLDLSTFSDKDKAVFVCSALAGAYGFTAEGLIDFISELLSGTQVSGNNTITASAEDLTNALEKHEKEFKDILEYRFPLMMQEAESSLNFSFMISNTNVKQFLNDVLTVLEKDTTFKQALVEYATAMGEPMTSAELDAMLKESHGGLDELDEAPFEAAVSITASKDRIINSASLTVFEDGNTESGTLAPKKQIARILISLPASGGFNIEATVDGQTVTVGYTVTEFGTVTKEVLSIGTMGITLTPVTFTYDSANGDYELKLEIPGAFSATASGKYTATKKEATLTVSSIKMTISPGYDVSVPENPLAGLTGQTIDLPMTLTVTAKASDTVPKAPTSYKDIAKLSEEELSELEEKIMNDPVILTYIEMIESLFADSNLEDFPIVE